MLVAAGLLAPAPAQASVAQDGREACFDGGGNDQLCRGFEHVLITGAGYPCRQGGGGDACAEIDGRTVDPALVTSHEKSWLAASLAHQRVLDDDLPMQEELWAHTHNSFNAEAYRDATLYGIDPNQLYTITDQLRMGIRAIEIDLHWSPHHSGDPNAVVVCHGNERKVQEGAVVHAGCMPNDPLLSTRLTEFRAWLDAHPGEVVMLYLENTLDGEQEAHDEAAAQLEAALGDVTYKPEATCRDLPIDVSRRQIREAHKQVILTGNCGAGGAWGGLVHDRGTDTQWDETSLGYDEEFPAYPCIDERTQHDYAHDIIRRYGDETGLSTGIGQGGINDATDALNEVRCGVNLIGFDNLVPFDARLEAIVWSWARSEPRLSREGACAYEAADGRFHSIDCKPKVTDTKGKKQKKKKKKKQDDPGIVKSFACRSGDTWSVTTSTGAWSKGPATCAKEHRGTFAVPRNGYQNEQLKAATPSAKTEVWLNYAYAQGSGWRPNA